MKKLYGIIVALFVMQLCLSAGLTKNDSINGHEFVDLGLSVKWATCNVGASTPEDYGDYFAWGETATKKSYWLDTYRFRTSGEWIDETTFSKYNFKSGRGNVDNKERLDFSDDVARTKWGSFWRMPTKTEWDELRDNCTWTWISNGGVKGYKVTSKKNGKSIFLPAAGGIAFSSVNNDGDACYWSSTLYKDNPGNAYSLYFDSKEIKVNYHGRHLGLSVRSVF
ncbi:MAG: hypothetical protein IKZ50_01670 [Bacteroidales bacterium]|nr:hypothetical protein [Bacteroidales bacterium]